MKKLNILQILGILLFFSVIGSYSIAQQVIIDPEDDQESGYPSWMDIVQASVIYNDDNDELTFMVEVAEPIPDPPNVQFGINWFIDYAESELTRVINDISAEIAAGMRYLPPPGDPYWGVGWVDYFFAWEVLLCQPYTCMDWENRDCFPSEPFGQISGLT